MLDFFHEYRENLRAVQDALTRRWKGKSMRTQQVTISMHKSVMGVDQSRGEIDYECASVTAEHGSRDRISDPLH